MPCGMCHITPLFWRCLRKVVQPALEVRVVQEVQEVQEMYKKEVEVEKRIRRRGNDQGSPNVASSNQVILIFHHLKLVRELKKIY